jgi:transcriptional regulator with GAF, ATPase, and Fis domain
VPINPDALASSIAGLSGLTGAAGPVEHALEHVVAETDRIFAVDGAGLLLLAEGDVLRYVAASDERGTIVEKLQEQIGEGPCLDAFEEGDPTLAADLAADARWPTLGPLAGEHGIHAVLGVPVRLDDSPVGTLNVYSSRYHEWDDGEIEAIQAFARIVASVLRGAIDAHVQGKLTTQLQYALDRRIVIEQAKGILMEREGLPAEAAFERIRRHARSSRERVADVARRVVEGETLDPRPAG